VALAAPAMLTMLAILASCGPPADQYTLTAVAFGDLPGWRDDSAAAALPALARSCGVLEALPADRALGPEAIAAFTGTAADWRKPCAALAALPAGDDAVARAYFERWFQPYRAAIGGEAEGLFTGYYEAELRGAWRRSDRYTVPLHARPKDLVDVDLGRFSEEWRGRRIVGQLKGGRLEPYPARARIGSEAMTGDLPVLMWVDDAADAFVLHIQGSGRVRLADDTEVRVGYAANNGHPFVSIGRKMLDRGLITPANASMGAIRAWIRANPKAAGALIDEYPRYIFFRVVQGAGPVGAQGVALTAGRSLAVDPAYVPLGAPLWLDTSHPGAPDKPLRRLVVAQDIGGAIKGAVRGDLFWGTGEAAFAEAGRMKQKGRYFLLLPRSLAARAASSY